MRSKSISSAENEFNSWRAHTCVYYELCALNECERISFVDVMAPPPFNITLNEMKQFLCNHKPNQNHFELWIQIIKINFSLRHTTHKDNRDSYLFVVVIPIRNPQYHILETKFMLFCIHITFNLVVFSFPFPHFHFVCFCRI